MVGGGRVHGGDKVGGDTVGGRDQEGVDRVHTKDSPTIHNNVGLHFMSEQLRTRSRHKTTCCQIWPTFYDRTDLCMICVGLTFHCTT
jgi:hypothetical protein